MSLSGWRHGRAAGSDGQAAQPPNGIADHRRASDGDNLIGYGAPRASAPRIVAPDTRTENPAERVEFTRWNVQK